MPEQKNPRYQEDKLGCSCGCGVKVMRASGMPRLAAFMTARSRKAMVTRGVVGIPSFSTEMQ